MYRQSILSLRVLALSLVLLLAGCSTAPQPAPASSGQPTDQTPAAQAPAAQTPAPQAPAAQATPAPAQSAAQPLPKVTVGSLASTASVAWFVADELKLGQKHGIDFELKIFQDPDQKDAGFAAGQFPVSTMAVDGGARLRGEGVPVSYIFGLVNSTNRIVVRKDFPGTTIGSLKGKKVGMPSKTGSMVVIYEQMAQAEGFKFLESTEVLTGPPPAIPQMIQDGKVDAVEIWEPFVSTLLATGEYKILVNPAEWYAAQYGDNFAFISVIARDEFLANDPDSARGFVAMTAEGAQWVKDHPLEAARIMSKSLRITDETVIQTLGQELAGTIATRWDGETGQNMQPYLDWVAAAGQLRSRPDQGLFRTEFTPKS